MFSTLVGDWVAWKGIAQRRGLLTADRTALTSLPADALVVMVIDHLNEHGDEDTRTWITAAYDDQLAVPVDTDAAREDRAAAFGALVADMQAGGYTP